MEPQETAAKPNGSPPAEASKAKTLVQKLCEVMATVHRIPKRGHNDFHHYDYVMEADLCDAVRDELAKRSVIILPSVTKEERLPLTEKQVLTRVEMTYTFMDGENGETFETMMVGYGSDAGDKGIYKAITGCTKYLLMKTFLIATGDDPEGDERVDKAMGKEAAKDTAKRKIADLKEAKATKDGPVPALFYTWFEESETARITGDEGLLTKHRDMLKKFWHPAQKAIIVGLEDLEGLKVYLEREGVLFRSLKAA